MRRVRRRRCLEDLSTRAPHSEERPGGGEGERLQMREIRLQVNLARERHETLQQRPREGEDHRDGR